MKTNIKKASVARKIVSSIALITLLGSNLTFINTTNAASTKVIFPIKEVSKLECRYTEFDELSSDCKQNLPTLKTKDYTKYIKSNGGYNDYTRYYTVLWGASYKYGWDVGFGGHQGTDIASSKGTPIYSIADGVIINAKKMLGWGNVVTVEHLIEGKKVFSNYAHLSKILVTKGDKVKVGKKIGEMGSTGNSTGNHLHFQIDLDTPFHPYYYDYKACPYSYSQITEDGVCFDELTKNTIDPLLFLETNGAILNDIKKTNKVDRVTNPTKVYNKNKNYDTDGINKVTTNSNVSIFNKTVYVGYAKSDIREVQQILRDLNLYNGSLTGKYEDIENIIFKFQVDKGILDKKSDLGAGWFGPKTRTAVKVEYDKFLKSGKKHNYVVIDKKESESKGSVSNNNSIKTQKIERTKLMTREELEKLEYDNFIKSYDFDLKLNNLGGNIKIGKSSLIDFAISKKYKKDKYFKGVTPLDISIVTDNSILTAFPKKFSSMKSGSREIKLTGKKSGSTIVKIMFGDNLIKTYKIRVYSNSDKIYINSADVYGNSKVVLGDNTKGIAIFRDDSKSKLINVKYGGTYKLQGVGDTKVCIKRGTAKNLSSVYRRECRPEEYKNEITFDYNDTIVGILIFDYKSIGNNAKYEIVNTYNSSVIASKKLTVSGPKGLEKNYVYHNDVINVLKNEIATNSSKGYFLEDRAITEYDSKVWIRNTLNKIKSDTYDSNTINDINTKLYLLSTESSSKTKNLTRAEFLEKSYKYLNLNNTITNGRNYKDLDDDLNKMAGVVFDNNITWKDRFGESYFQPNKNITRGEVAFLLNTVLTKTSKTYLTVR